MLMKIERIITVFEKSDGGRFLKEINADVIDLELLRKLFEPFDDDPNFYRPFQINEREYKELINYVDEIKLYSSLDYDLFIEAVQIT
jgi:hypothetical protein